MPGRCLDLCPFYARGQDVLGALRTNADVLSVSRIMLGVVRIENVGGLLATVSADVAPIVRVVFPDAGHRCC